MVGIEIPVIIDSKSKSAISQSEEYFLNKNDCYSRNYCIYLFYSIVFETRSGSVEENIYFYVMQNLFFTILIGTLRPAVEKTLK